MYYRRLILSMLRTSSKKCTCSAGIASANNVDKPDWKKATKDNKLEYSDISFDHLKNIMVPEAVHTCKDILCDDPNHKTQIDLRLRGFW